MQPFIGAVVQTAAVAFDPDRTVEKLGDFTAKAAAGGAKLVVFPEAFVGGYPKGLDFGARVGSRTAAGRESFRIYYDGAIDVPGPHVTRIGEIAASNAVRLVTGIIERDQGTLYCTVLFFAPDGTLLGKHRKLMPTAAERLVWGFGDGSTLPAFETPLGKLGAVICWENYMPMLRMAMRRLALLRTYRRRSRDMGFHHAPYRTGRPLLRVLGLPVHAAERLCHRRQSGSRHDPHARRQLHHRTARTDAGGAGLRSGCHSYRRNRRQRSCAGQVRFRRHRALCAAGCLPPDGQ